MTMVKEDTVRAYAFCQNAQCLGYQQEPVEGIRTVTEWTYLDLGGDMPGVERSTETVRFADESEAVCSHCEAPRAISEQLRPEYANISGHDPMGLFEFKGRTEGELREIRHNRELDELTRAHEAEKRDREIAELRTAVAELTAALSDKANKPGPKPKDA